MANEKEIEELKQEIERLEQRLGHKVDRSTFEKIKESVIKAAKEMGEDFKKFWNWYKKLSPKARMQLGIAGAAGLGYLSYLAGNPSGLLEAAAAVPLLLPVAAHLGETAKEKEKTAAKKLEQVL